MVNDLEAATDNFARARQSGFWLAIFLFTLFLAANNLGQATAQPAPSTKTRLLERANELPRLRSLLISLDGTMSEERYFNGARASRPENLKSASKSILSALIGIALDRGYIKSVEEPIDKYFPEYLRAGDGRKRAITIEDLLTMRSGLESTSNVNYGRWVQSGHWVRHVLSRPLIDEPGGRMIYSTGNSHLLSALLTKATKMSTYDFARRFLAEPLGAPLPPWARDPQGIYLGGNEMHWTPRGMVKFGELYLNRGRVGGKQVVSENWINVSLQPRTRSSWSGREYGYSWWIDSLGERPAYYAWGHGGQFIFVVPSLKLVTAITSVPSPGEGRREHQRAVYDFVHEEIIPIAERREDTAKMPSVKASFLGWLQ